MKLEVDRRDAVRKDTSSDLPRLALQSEQDKGRKEGKKKKSGFSIILYGVITSSSSCMRLLLTLERQPRHRLQALAAAVDRHKQPVGRYVCVIGERGSGDLLSTIPSRRSRRRRSHPSHPIRRSDPSHRSLPSLPTGLPIRIRRRPIPSSSSRRRLCCRHAWPPCRQRRRKQWPRRVAAVINSAVTGGRDGDWRGDGELHGFQLVGRAGAPPPVAMKLEVDRRDAVAAEAAAAEATPATPSAAATPTTAASHGPPIPNPRAPFLLLLLAVFVVGMRSPSLPAASAGSSGRSGLPHVVLRSDRRT
ncbi:hypothetical protein GN958_ATG14093 [Phytophthora infestans]|uniref:Uncharacterized protein n=1 Tax=Phytophthora infestans TaxID=4787 RepID=A0A8S9U724_PHYIN|nr:hypothetical protein GN958_ATG14093 [Phytophthora infestans]